MPAAGDEPSDLTLGAVTTWPRTRGYKTFFMLNSAEHEIFSANKYENANYRSFLFTEKLLCSAIFSKKEYAIVSNLRSISRMSFMTFHAKIKANS